MGNEKILEFDADMDLDEQQILDIEDRVLVEVKEHFGENYEPVDWKVVTKVIKVRVHARVKGV